MFTNELYHHGILGMKWGVRRYQKPDGSLTEAGRKRYGSGKSFTRYSSVDEKEVRKASYVSRTSNKHDFETYASDAFEGNLGGEKTDSIFQIKIKNIEPIVIADAKQVTEDIFNETGKHWYQKTQSRSDAKGYYERLKEAGYYDDNVTSDQMWDIMKTTLSKPDPKKNDWDQYKEIKKKGFLNKRHDMADYLHEQIYKDRDKFVNKYRDRGYDAIIDPEDYALGYKTAMIIINPEKFKIESSKQLNREKPKHKITKDAAENGRKAVDTLASNKKKIEHSEEVIVMNDLVSNELYHHGILGMKWGVRRYQNADGTLTEAGKKRYYNADGSFTNAGKKRLYKDAKNNIWSRDPKKHRRGTSLLNELEESDYLKAHASRLDAAKITEKRTRDELVKAERRNDHDVDSKGEAYRNAHDEVYKFQKQIVKELLGKYGVDKNDEYTEAGFAVMNQLFKNSEQRYEKRAEIKKEWMDKAKKSDQYDIDFLETVQNDPVLDKGGKELLKEYSKYLDDPNKYMHEFDRSDYFKKNPHLDHEDTSEDFLEHHGILGMKWGVRRYQNEDGSLTDAGKKRYNTERKVGFFEARRIKKKRAEAAKKRSETLAKKKAEEETAQQHEAEKQEAIRSGNATQIAKYQNELSNQELRDALDRLNSKQRLSDLVDKETPKKETKLDKAVKIAEKGAKYADIAEKGIKVYNTYAKISNTFADDDKQLPIIGEKREKKEAKDPNKEKAIRSGDPDELSKWKGKLSKDEVVQAYTIANNWQKIAELNPKQKAVLAEAGKAAAEKIFEENDNGGNSKPAQKEEKAPEPKKQTYEYKPSTYDPNEHKSTLWRNNFHPIEARKQERAAQDKRIEELIKKYSK